MGWQEDYKKTQTFDSSMIESHIPNQKNQNDYDHNLDEQQKKFGNDLNSLKVECNAKGQIRWSLKLKNKDPEKLIEDFISYGNIIQKKVQELSKTDFDKYKENTKKANLSDSKTVSISEDEKDVHEKKVEETESDLALEHYTDLEKELNIIPVKDNAKEEKPRNLKDDVYNFVKDSSEEVKLGEIYGKFDDIYEPSYIDIALKKLSTEGLIFKVKGNAYRGM